MTQPSKKEWADLYRAAIMFKEAAPWECVGKGQIFAVENPANGEVGYCAILPNGQKGSGLGMLLGQEAYDRYLDAIAEEGEPDDFGQITMMRSVALLFVDRGVLQEQDRAVIRSLGLRFRGKNAWPLFRSQEPGYVPWFLERKDARFLTSAIHQSLVVADEVKRGKLDLREPGREGFVLTRYCSAGNWLEEWRKAGKSEQERQACNEGISAVEEAQLYLLAGRAGKSAQTWELDIFMLATPVASASGKPYFPLCFLVVETKVGLVVDSKLTDPWLAVSEKRNVLLQIMNKQEQLPREIRVKSQNVGRVVEPMARVLGIKLRLGRLPMLEQAKASLQQYFADLTHV